MDSQTLDQIKQIFMDAFGKPTTKATTRKGRKATKKTMTRARDHVSIVRNTYNDLKGYCVLLYKLKHPEVFQETAVARVGYAYSVLSQAWLMTRPYEYADNGNMNRILAGLRQTSYQSIRKTLRSIYRILDDDDLPVTGFSFYSFGKYQMNAEMRQKTQRKLEEMAKKQYGRHVCGVSEDEASLLSLMEPQHVVEWLDSI